VVVPPIALVLDWLILRVSLKPALRGTALWWPIALVWILVANYAQPTHGIVGAPLYLRPLVALDAIAFYIGKLLWPIHLAVDYGRTPMIAEDRGWLWWTWLIPVAIAALLAWRPKRELIAAALIFVIAIAPVLGFVPFLFQYYTTVADHYLYLAMLGPALALAWVLARWHQSWLRIVCAAAIVLLAVLSIRQTGIWQNDHTLFAHTMRVNPDSFLARHNPGTALVREGDLTMGTRESLEKFSQARDLYVEAIAIRKKVNRGKDDYYDAHQNLALTLERLGLWEAALDERLTAVRINLSFPPAAQGDLGGQMHRIARDLMVLKRWREALKYLDESLRLEPGNAAAQADRKQVLEMMGK
jgi:tetratricopeptide (TPR) repeat protein